MEHMRVELERTEAELATRCLLLLQSIQRQAQEQQARVIAKLREVEEAVRKRVPDLPPTPITEWRWGGVDMLSAEGAVEIPDDGGGGS